MPNLLNFARITGRLLAFRKVDVADIPASPAVLVALWIATGSLYVLDFAVIPADGSYSASNALVLVCAILLGSVLAAWIIGRGSDAIRFGTAFLATALVGSVAWLGLLLLPVGEEALMAISVATGAVFGWWVCAVFACLVRASEGAWRRSRSVLAVVVCVAIMEAAMFVPYLDYQLAVWAYEQEEEQGSPSDYVEVDADALWPAQPRLVTMALAKLGRQQPSTAPYIIAIAAGGSQQLFGREAKAVLSSLEKRYGPAAGSVLLSNAEADLEKVPLANETNLSTILEGVGKSFRPERDLAIVYLTAHGGADAALQTDLPDFTTLHDISAANLADMLDKNGISRRIVIVSACYSGTWIKPLRSPDTIVITAAAADRTSFGCDDQREYTVFGDALLKSGLARGGSLEQAFAALKKRVAEEETKERVDASLPQVFVGERMREVWTARAN